MILSDQKSDNYYDFNHLVQTTMTPVSRQPADRPVTVWNRIVGICRRSSNGAQGRIWAVNLITPSDHLDNNGPLVWERRHVPKSSQNGLGEGSGKIFEIHCIDFVTIPFVTQIWKRQSAKKSDTSRTISGKFWGTSTKTKLPV